jgi:hypothetical protein
VFIIIDKARAKGNRVIDLQHARYMGQEIASALANSQRRKGMQPPAESEEAQTTEANHQPAAIAPMTEQRVSCM